MGNKKYYFNNPIHQNYGHIKTLQEVLNLEESNFVSIVCISNRAKVRVISKNVVQLDYINYFIKSFEKEIVKTNLVETKELLEAKNIKDKSARKVHVKNIKSNIKDKEIKEKNMICPKCGNKLIERNGKYGEFIGCSNYPKCKYTIQNKK